MTTTQQEREAFDRAYDAYEFRREYDKYGPTEAAWSIWQAALSHLSDAQKKEGEAKPVLWVARAKCDSEDTIVGELSVDDISEEQFELHNPDVWECIPLYTRTTLPQRDEPAAEGKADILLSVIQRLNANPYSLTKGECIAEVEAMRRDTTRRPSLREVQADEPDAVLAARYRWLRNHPGQIGAILWPHAPWTQELFEASRDRFDLCIDEEIAAELARLEGGK